MAELQAEIREREGAQRLWSGLALPILCVRLVRGLRGGLVTGGGRGTARQRDPGAQGSRHEAARGGWIDEL